MQANEKKDNVAKIPLAKETPAIGVSINVKMGPRVDTVVQTHFAQDEDYAKQLDAVFKVVDKHKARYEIEEIEAQLHKFEYDLAATKAEHELSLAQIKEEWQKRGKQAEFRLDSGQKAAMQRYESSIQRGKIEIDRMEKEIVKRQKLVDGK